MAYASVIHVAALDQGRATYGANTKPNASQVHEWLGQTAAEIDSILRGRGYEVPASPPSELLQLYNAQGADALVQQSAQNSGRRKEAWAAWESAKKALKTLELDIGRSSASEQSRAADWPEPAFSMASSFRDR